jgi:phospholipid/cholesterol/gamma-HCH transport system substrate-binding protein
MKKYGNEFKVGLFFIICVLGFLYLSYSTGKIGIKKDGYYIYVTFNDVAGLDSKAPVMLNGLEVGKVDDIQVSYDGQDTNIVLKIWLDADAKIRDNPTVYIKTLGLMGEKYIQISSTEGEGFIKPDTNLKGRPYVDMDLLLDNVNSLTDEVKKLSTNLNYTVESNQDKISKIITNLESASFNLDEFTEDVKRHPWKLLFRTKEKKN